LKEGIASVGGVGIGILGRFPKKLTLGCRIFFKDVTGYSDDDMSQINRLFENVLVFNFIFWSRWEGHSAPPFI
jgi:hypothetical protein